MRGGHPLKSLGSEARPAMFVAEAANVQALRCQSVMEGQMHWCWSATHCVLPLQSQFQQMHKERGWIVGFPVDIPHMPTSDVQDSARWMSQHNCELRNAIEFGDPVRGLVEGASMLSTVGCNFPEMARTSHSRERTIRFEGCACGKGSLPGPTLTRGSPCHQCTRGSFG